MKDHYLQEQKYLLAKKKVEKIKGLYAHLLVTILIIPVLVVINLKFVPDYHWFYYPAIGMLLGLFFHWFGVYGIEKIGLGKDWEKRKIKEFLEKNHHGE
ncbi:2TM domain-containing protein [Tenacibaculum tangerinum]|uniref:2TM domain-containing protein n=1 Tax=Tenacibaculum tangerinum TaxID=3038772 RepID=A0ABY8L315_9FLAO|nr:2TM domain-containing protein [Tenacibaculum tangerinum]WGH75819.1 2TM domain-containing protein [Tenacibaculum tangerinum]